MRFLAEVHCYHCGYVSGTWEWSAGHAEYGLFTEGGGAGRRARGLLRQLRCLRCGGPVLLEESVPVVEQPPLVLTPSRRGRPPKHSQPLAS
jgi:hypothetical protein